MKIGIVFKEENSKARKVAGDAEKFLKKNGVDVAGEKNLKGSQCIFTFGGDGTLIYKSSQFAELGIPFIGINTGNIGFLTAEEANNWQKALEKVVKGAKVYTSERMTLDVGIEGAKEKHRAVNEAVVKGIYRVAELKIHINDEEFLKVLGDGVIVATQTGSTAYSLSSGGSIVDPEINSFSVTFINPIGLPIPSVVFSPDDEIKAEVVRGDDISLIIDGQEHQKAKEGQFIKVVRGKHNVKFGYFDEHRFLKSLKAKFGLSNRR